MRRFLFVLTALSAVLLSCNQSDSPAEKRAAAIRRNKGSVVIAAAGSWSVSSNNLWQGISLATEEVNMHGGVLGRNLSVMKVDDQNTVTAGQQAAYKICENNLVSAVIGHVSSSISIQNAIIYQYYGVVMLSPYSVASKLTGQNFPFVFRNIQMDQDLGTAAADFCRQKGWNKVLIYNADTEYGQSLANWFEKRCPIDRIKIIDRKSFSTESSDIEMSETAESWRKNFRCDAIFLTGAMPFVAKAVLALHTSMPDTPIIGGETLVAQSLLGIAGMKAENVYATAIADMNSTSGAVLKFKTAFIAKFGFEPDTYALQGYDAVKLLVYAMQTAGSAEPVKIANALHTVTDWDGPAGPYDITSTGDVKGRPVVIQYVKNGQFVNAE